MGMSRSFMTAGLAGSGQNILVATAARRWDKGQVSVGPVEE